MIGLFTGLRHSPNLRAEDVDVARRILWIGKDKAGRREQPMPQVLADYLSEFIRGLSPDQLLFGSSKSSMGRVHQMNTIFARCAERAGISKHVTPHTLRLRRRPTRPMRVWTPPPSKPWGVGRRERWPNAILTPLLCRTRLMPYSGVSPVSGLHESAGSSRKPFTGL